MKTEQPTSVWIPPGELAVIDEASSMLGKSRSEFMRETGVRRARALIESAERLDAGLEAES